MVGVEMDWMGEMEDFIVDLGLREDGSCLVLFLRKPLSRLDMTGSTKT